MAAVNGMSSQWSALWTDAAEANPLTRFDPAVLPRVEQTVGQAATALERPMRAEWDAFQKDVRSATMFVRKQWSSNAGEPGTRSEGRGEAGSVTG